MELGYWRKLSPIALLPTHYINIHTTHNPPLAKRGVGEKRLTPESSISVQCFYFEELSQSIICFHNIQKKSELLLSNLY